jgi:MGT family glycosyltransferase
MAKYAMFSSPGHGHVNPTLAIAQELVARGEQVIYYLPESFRAAVEATGATFHPYEWQRSPSSFPTPGKKADATLIIGWMMEMMVQQSFHILPQLLEKMRAEQVDAILYDRMFLPANLLSRILHLPAVILNPSYAVNAHSRAEQMMPQEKRQAFAEFFTRLSKDLDRLFDTYQLPHYDFQALMQADLNIVFLPRAFQPGGETFDERFVFVGPSLQEHRHDSSDFPLDRLGKRPQLYISLGTAFNNQPAFYRQCFDAFAQTEWQIVLAFGQQIDPAELKTPPDNFIVAPHVPQLEILPHSDVFVSHGGMNSTMESLSFGVPLVVVPQMEEQAMTARRVQELGLGLALDMETLTAETLRASVEQVAHASTFRAHVQEMQHEIHQSGGAPRAVDAIIAYIHDVQRTGV